MPLLLETDYEELKERGIEYVEDADRRFLVLLNYRLPAGLYRHAACDVLVVIPKNYNQDGNDMIWTYPRLARADGKPISATHDFGAKVNHAFQDKEFCRWSRHWRHRSSAWRAGKDDIVTILWRIEWAFCNPDAQ